MAKIPQSDIPQVKPVMPQVGVPSPPSSSGLGELSEGMMKLGKAIYNKAEEQENLNVESETNYKRISQQRLIDEAQEKTGRQIDEPDPKGDDPNLPLKESLLSRYDEETAFQMAEMSPSARAKFERNAQRLRTELEYKVDKHFDAQRNAIQKETLENTDATEVNHIVKYGVDKDSLQPDGAVIAQSEARRVANAEAMARYLGTDPAKAKEIAIANTQGLVMDILVNRDSPALETYWNLHKHQLTPETRLRLEKTVETKKNYWTAAALVPQLVEKYAIPGTNQFDYDASLLDLYSRPGMTENLKNTSKSLLNERLDAIHKSNGIRIEANTNKVIGSYIDTGSAAVAVNTPEFLNLRQISEPQAANLRNTLYSWENQAIAEREGLKDPNRWIGQSAAYWAATQDSERLKNMEPQEVFFSDLPKILGKEYHGQLVKRWNALRTPEGQQKLTDVKIPDNEVKEMFVRGGLGIPPKNKKALEEFNAKKVVLRDLVEADIRAFQTNPKVARPITQPERDAIIKRWTTKMQVQDKGWFGRTIMVEKFGYEVPQAVVPLSQPAQVSEGALQSLESAMVAQGLLTARKAGEAISQERRAKILQHLGQQTPQPIEESELEKARQEATKPTQAPPVAGSVSPAATATKPLPAGPGKVDQALKFLFPDYAKHKGEPTRTQFYEAIREMTKAGLITKKQSEFTNEDWNKVKDYIRKGQK